MIPVFDLGNVMILHDHRRFYAAVGPACANGAALEEAVSASFEREDVGRGGDFERIYPQVVARTGLRLSREEFRLAWNDIFDPNPGMVELVAGLPHPRVLLSNTHEPHVSWIKARFPEVFPLFDHHVLSNEVKLVKPEAAIYRCVEALTGAPPEAHVFVDDMEANVAGARAVGWRGIVFTGVEDCRARLAALGVVECS